MRINLYASEMSVEDASRAASMLQGSHFERGELVAKFEHELSLYTKGKVVAVSSGTAALHLALRAFHLPRGSEVLTSAISFIATTNVILLEGLVPVFGRVTKDLQLDLDNAARLIEQHRSIKAIIVPHIYGLFPKYGQLAAIKRRFPEIKILEDCAQAFPYEPSTQHIAEESDAAILSFHENKPVTTFGEGGAVVTRDKALFNCVLAEHEHGRSAERNWLDHTILGFNYRMTEIQAAAGIVELQHLQEIMQRRSHLADQYESAFTSSKAVCLLPKTSENRSWFGYYILFHQSCQAHAAHEALNDQGIQTRCSPMPPIYCFHHIRQTKHITCDENSSQIITRVLAIPFRSNLPAYLPRAIGRILERI